MCAGLHRMQNYPLACFLPRGATAEGGMGVEAPSKKVIVEELCGVSLQVLILLIVIVLTVLTPNISGKSSNT